MDAIVKLNANVERPYIISLSYGIISSEEFGNYSAEELIIESDRRMFENKIHSKPTLKILRKGVLG